jgi:hypothetical protein
MTSSASCFLVHPQLRDRLVFRAAGGWHPLAHTCEALQHEPEDLILLKTYFDTFNAMLFDGVLVPTRCPMTLVLRHQLRWQESIDKHCEGYCTDRGHDHFSDRQFSDQFKIQTEIVIFERRDVADRARRLRYICKYYSMKCSMHFSPTSYASA